MNAPAPEEGPPPPLFVLLYESADDVAAKAPAHFPAHKVRLDEFHARGDLLMVGTFGDPQREGSMASSGPGRPPRSSWPTIRSCSMAWSGPGRSGSGTRLTGMRRRCLFAVTYRRFGTTKVTNPAAG